jgi:hypothetical protein
MGLLANFIVATREDALKYDTHLESESPLPPGRFQIAAYKNFTDLALGKLWAALCDEEWRVDRHRLEYMGDPREEGTWLFRFPTEFVHLLSSMNGDGMDRIAGAWMSEEVPGNADELKPVLRDLRYLAGEARLADKNLFLWLSL